MLTALKILIERQVEDWNGKPTTFSLNPKISSCGFRPSPASGLGSLQSGASLVMALPGEVSERVEPSFESRSITVQSRREVSSDQREGLGNFFREFGLSIQESTSFPAQNPLTLETIDWDKEISRGTLEALNRASYRLAKTQTLSQDAKLNRLVQLMFLALQSGNIALAMMIFSHVETRTANELTKTLMQKVQALQDQKRKLTQDIQNQKNDAEGNKKIQSIQNEVSQTSDDIAVLQTFIRDVAQNKQTSIEVANAFLSKEHETTMAVVSSFGR